MPELPDGAHIDSVRPDELETWLDWRERVLEEVFADVPTPLGVDLRTRNREYVRRSMAADACILCFARNVEGEIIGCGGACLWNSMPSPENLTGRIAFVMSVYVVPERRGDGLGQAIVSWVLDEAERRGITEVLLDTTAAGRPVYEKLGFTDAHGFMVRWRKGAH